MSRIVEIAASKCSTPMVSSCAKSKSMYLCPLMQSRGLATSPVRNKVSLKVELHGRSALHRDRIRCSTHPMHFPAASIRCRWTASFWAYLVNPVVNRNNSAGFMRSPARRKTRSTLRKSSTGACRGWSCARIRRRGHQRRQTSSESPPREEGWLRHQENFGEAHLSAADGVVAHNPIFGVSDHPGRFASTPPHEEGNAPSPIL